jgi:cobalt-zinc-cadmium efflux system protein
VTRTRRLKVALGINLALVVGQVAAGVVAHSTSLLADAGHNLTDVAGLALALAAVRWALRPRSANRTFGNHRGTILAALANSAALAVMTGLIVALSVTRLVHPKAVDGGVMVVVAAVAVAANLAAALVLAEPGRDLNMRAAMVHMVADVAASLTVLAAGLVIVATGGGAWDRVDPIASLVVAALIVAQAVGLVRESAEVLLESTPADLDVAELRAAMAATPGVGDVHDLHVWSLSSEVRALSAHLVLTGHPSLEEAQAVAGAVRATVEVPFGLAHTTLELECERCDDDLDDPCGMDSVTVGGGAAGHHH